MGWVSNPFLIFLFIFKFRWKKWAQSTLLENSCWAFSQQCYWIYPTSVKSPATNEGRADSLQSPNLSSLHRHRTTFLLTVRVRLDCWVCIAMHLLISVLVSSLFCFIPLRGNLTKKHSLCLLFPLQQPEDGLLSTDSSRSVLPPRRAFLHWVCKCFYLGKIHTLLLA